MPDLSSSDRAALVGSAIPAEGQVLGRLQRRLAREPEAGDVMSGIGGFRKLRGHSGGTSDGQEQ